MLTMMIKITLVYKNKTSKCTTTKYTKCTTTKHKKCIMYCRNAYVSYFNSLVFNGVYLITQLLRNLCTFVLNVLCITAVNDKCLFT